MLNILSNAHGLARLSKVLLDCLPWRDGGGGVALAEEVPAQEAAEELDSTEGLVAAECGGDEAQVVGDRRVVNEGVGDHSCGVARDVDEAAVGVVGVGVLWGKWRIWIEEEEEQEEQEQEQEVLFRTVSRMVSCMAVVGAAVRSEGVWRSVCHVGRRQPRNT